MKRYTVKLTDNPTYIPDDNLWYVDDEFGVKCLTGDAVNRLAEYEDIGFSPKEIKEIFKNVFDAFNKTTDGHVKKIGSYDCRDINEMVFVTNNMKKSFLKKKNDCENFK